MYRLRTLCSKDKHRTHFLSVQRELGMYRFHTRCSRDKHRTHLLSVQRELGMYRLRTLCSKDNHRAQCCSELETFFSLRSLEITPCPNRQMPVPVAIQQMQSRTAININLIHYPKHRQMNPYLPIIFPAR